MIVFILQIRIAGWTGEGLDWGLVDFFQVFFYYYGQKNIFADLLVSGNSKTFLTPIIFFQNFEKFLVGNGNLTELTFINLVHTYSYLLRINQVFF